MLAVAFQHGRLRCRAFYAAHHSLAPSLGAGAGSDLDLAVIVGQPQLTPAEKLARWKRFN